MNYQQFWRRLAQVYNEGEAKAIARMVYEMRYGLSLSDIFLGKINQLTADDQAELEKILQRLLQNEPVQYVLGETEFCGRLFSVSPDVLIPRPETAELCGWIRKRFSQSPSPGNNGSGEASPFILDIGTGNGCIAITLATELPEAKVTAWDISMKSLEIAKNNARRHQVDIHFQQVDILKLPHELGSTEGQAFDLIVSNPPYICEKEKTTMEPHVLDYEPPTALFVPDDDPLVFYRAIGCYAISHLQPQGMLAVEINRAYGPETCELFKNIGFTDITLLTDSDGNDRFVIATL